MQSICKIILKNILTIKEKKSTNEFDKFLMIIL